MGGFLSFKGQNIKIKRTEDQIKDHLFQSINIIKQINDHLSQSLNIILCSLTEFPIVNF